MPTPTSTAPATPAAATTAPTPKTFPVVDVTPKQPAQHRVTIAAADVPALIAGIDSTAPEGKKVRSIQCSFNQAGDLTVTISYNP